MQRLLCHAPTSWQSFLRVAPTDFSSVYARIRDTSDHVYLFGAVFAVVALSTKSKTARMEDKPKRHDANGYLTNDVAGCPYPPFLKKAAVDQLQKDFALRDSDIVIATYPKCGTTWMQNILLALQFDGDKSKVRRPMVQSPWIEVIISTGRRTLQQLMDWDGDTEWSPAPERRVFKTHAPVELAPWKGGINGLGKSKVVVVTRNPKDACVSLYHHARDLAGVFDYRGDFQHFASELFLKGNAESGCFWAWHAGWQRAAEEHPSDIIWISYEELKRDPLNTTRRLADFLGMPLSDDVVLKSVNASSFQQMKQVFAEEDKKVEARGQFVKKNHIRQGEMGSWVQDIDGALLAEFDAISTLKCDMLGLTYKFDFGDLGC